ncbi:MAG: AsmA family protein, partial [Bacteroidales bacterium]|nr:AsmA family protein [Bacteroidales bacterium]
MKKIFKKIAKILAILLVVVLALMIIIPMFFSDKILNYGCQLAKDYINADLYVKDLNLNLFKHFPDATIRIDDVYLKGVGEFEKDTLAKFDKLETTVNLMSLFGGKIKVKQVTLERPQFNIIVLKNGHPNYDIVKTDSTDVEEEVVDTLPTSSFKLALKKFEIIDMRVSYTDSITDVHALIDSLNFKLKGDLSDKETILSMLMDIAKLNVRMGPIIYINDAVVDVKSDLDADMEKMKFTFKENVFRINQLALNLDGWIAVPDTNIRMDLKFGADNTDFKSVLSMIPADYAKDLEGVKTSGKFSFDGGAKGDFNAVSFPEFWVNLLVDDARFQYPDLPKSVEDINVDVKVKCPGNLDSINIDAKKVHLNIAANPIDARFLIQTSAKDIDLAGDVNASLELASVADVVPLEDMTLK